MAVGPALATRYLSVQPADSWRRSRATANPPTVKTMTNPITAVALRPMQPHEFDAWRQSFLADWALDLARVETLDPDNALREATRRTDGELSDGLATPGHHLFVFTVDARPVGSAWVSIGARGAFLDDLTIAHEQRGRGIGRAAMALLEAELRRLGQRRLDLHVYADNPAAIALYQASGFRATGLKMCKIL